MTPMEKNSGLKDTNGPQNRYDQANSIAADNLGNVYVTGYSYVGVQSE